MAVEALEPLLSDAGLGVRVAAAAGARRPGPLPRAVRPRLADHRAAGAAGGAGGRGRDAAGARGAAGPRGRSGDGRGAGQDPARVPPRRRAAVRRGRLAGARRRAALLRQRRQHELVPRRARRAPGRRARRRARGRAAARRRVAGAGARRRRRARALRAAARARRARAPGLARRDRRPSPSTPRASGIVRPDGSDPAAAARRRRLPGGRARGAATRSRGSTRTATGTRGRRRCARGVAEAFAPGADWALAIEADGTAVPGAGSQLGWLLWAGALEPDLAGAAARAARRARRPHGVRAAHARRRRIPRSGPATYHRGGIWPFDCWLGWGGLRAPGCVAEAERVRDRRARCARPARPGAGAVRGLGGGRARADPGRQPGPGLDGRRALGARARLGRPRQ